MTAILLWATGLSVASAENGAGTAPATSAQAAPAATVTVDQVAVLSAEQVIQILDDTVDWYRTLGVQQQNATQPSDLLILFANRQTADQVVSLAFEIARANAELLSSEASAGQSAADGPSPEALDQQLNRLQAQRQGIQTEIDANQRLVAGGKAREEIAAKLRELTGELAMVDARRNLLATMADFVAANDPKGAGANALKAHIDAIAATIPNAAATATAPAAGATAPGSVASVAGGAAAAAPAALTAAPGTETSSGAGIWDLGASALKLRGKLATIDGIDQHTASLAATFKDISGPSLKQLRAYAGRSDALAAQADHAGSDALKSLRGEFDTLAWLFKQTSAILIPLTEEQVLLRQYRHNLGNWRDATRRQYREALSALGVRLLVLGAILAAVFLVGEVARRAVLRYVHEPRRRYQLLLVRKILVWTGVIVVAGLSFATHVSTFATFAGLLTAGLAVAMQSVLVSVVGYFFLIGKYGIRVGDRVQIGAVVGEVIDLGLVRMHLMELNTQGPLGPTGRVVAFANLVVFQASSGLFKQIPGVTLSTHETTVTLPVVDDYAALKDRLLGALAAVTNSHQEEFARQTQQIERSTASSALAAAAPEVHLHLADGRMQALIRYPVHLDKAADIDEAVSEAVLKVLAGTGAAGALP